MDLSFYREWQQLRGGWESGMIHVLWCRSTCFFDWDCDSRVRWTLFNNWYHHLLRFGKLETFQRSYGPALQSLNWFFLETASRKISSINWKCYPFFFLIHLWKKFINIWYGKKERYRSYQTIFPFGMPDSFCFKSLWPWMLLKKLLVFYLILLKL